MKRAAALFLTTLLALASVAAAAKVTPPEVLETVDAEYTLRAQEARIEGKVVLDLTVGETGKVENVTVIQPLSHGLTESAVAAARQWKFEAPKEGVVVVRITLKFALL